MCVLNLRRFHNPSLDEVEAREEEVSSFTCQEDPDYKASLESNRERAFKTVSAYVDSLELEEAASLLFQVHTAVPPLGHLL